MPEQKLALLSVPEAFGLDELHNQLMGMYDESFKDPGYWRALMGVSQAPGAQMPQSGPYAPQNVDPSRAHDYAVQGTDLDPNTWFGDMAARGLPGTEESDRYEPPAYVQSPGEHAADLAASRARSTDALVHQAVTPTSPVEWERRMAARGGLGIAPSKALPPQGGSSLGPSTRQTK